MYGLSKDSTETELIENIDEKTAIRYKVVKEEINLERLKAEKQDLQNQLGLPEPSNEELIETGKMTHPYYIQDKSYLETKIAEIDQILKG